MGCCQPGLRCAPGKEPYPHPPPFTPIPQPPSPQVQACGRHAAHLLPAQPPCHPATHTARPPFPPAQPLTLLESFEHLAPQGFEIAHQQHLGQGAGQGRVDQGFSVRWRPAVHALVEALHVFFLSCAILQVTLP